MSISRRRQAASACVLTLLAALAAHPAAAQTLSLQNSDRVSVSGSGTTGTYQG